MTAAQQAGYATIIREELDGLAISGFDVRHVEAFMRLEHGTLDGLSPFQFQCAVDRAVESIIAEGEAVAESLAQSFGLLND